MRRRSERDEFVGRRRTLATTRTKLRPRSQFAHRAEHPADVVEGVAGAVQLDAVLAGLEFAQHIVGTADRDGVEERHRDRLHPLLERRDPDGLGRPRRLRDRQVRDERGRPRALEVEQVVAVGGSLSADQDHVALHAEAARAGDAIGDVEHFEERRVGRRPRELRHEFDDAFALPGGRLQGFRPVDPQQAPAPLDHRALVEKLGAAPRAQRIEQRAHAAARGLALDPAGLAGCECSRVTIEDIRAERQGLVLRQRQPGRRGEHAREEAREVPCGGCERGLVEVVQVEVDEPVVALVAAEVLEVQVAAGPRGG